MANWAIVIGIDQYWRPNICLKGAVRDSLKIREWLISVDGGAVPTHNLTLLLAPSPTSPSPPAGVQFIDPSYANIVNAINLLINRSGGQGERFFFYYSGHGLLSRMNSQNESGITAADFTDQLTTMSLKLGSLYEKFQATQFREQFFFIDACRNIPWEGEFVLGQIPRPGGNPKPPVPPQFIMYATSPGVKAVEIQQAGDERGAFTEALLYGLQGKGTAKAWDDQADKYIVRWYRLFKAVEGEVKERQLNVDNTRVPPLFQEPSQHVEGGSQDPELGCFPAGAFPSETLAVNLEPETVAQQAEVIAADLSGAEHRVSNIKQLPVQFKLEPRTYSVRANAPGYFMGKRCYPVDLYGSATVSVRLMPRPLGLDSTPILPTDITKDIKGASASSKLIVHSWDHLAWHEVADNTGRVLYTGEGDQQYQNIRPGFYRVRLVTPEGSFVEQLVELLPGETDEIQLKAPQLPEKGLLREVITASNIKVGVYNTIHPSEAVGAVSSAQLSTILALAGGAINEESLSGKKLRKIGNRSFWEMVGTLDDSGLQILFGFEAGTPDQIRKNLTQIKLRCWEQTQPVPEFYLHPVQFSEFVGLAELAWVKAPGPYWLSIEMPDQRPIILAISILPHRLTLVVFHQDAVGQVNIYQYLPSLISGKPNDPGESEPRFPVLRLSELIQRSFMSGHLDQPIHYALELLDAKWFEPIANCLGGYILLKVDPYHPLLKVAVDKIIKYSEGLSDSYVLKGEYEASKGQENLAEEAFRTALDRGIPVMSDGLVRLVEGIRRFQIQHARADFVQDVFKNRMSGLLWTTFSVQNFNAGQLLRV